MDANKFKKLKKIDYQVRRVCYNCKFMDNRSHSFYGFTTCNKHQYEHLKHTDSMRDFSVVYTGCCSEHQYREGFLDSIHRFAELKEK